MDTAASHNIVCNLPFDGGSDENQPVEMSELLHDSLGSTCKTKEEMLSLPVQQHVENGSPVRADSDKGKCILEFPPVLTCNSSKNKYIQVIFRTQFLFVSNNSCSCQIVFGVFFQETPPSFTDSVTPSFSFSLRAEVTPCCS